ncbi:unnamed protein product [Calicophoron daubneyi]|uniref:CEP152 CEP63 binding coiled coil domain-containing protein n=1 Tax=Calicophoron daubneyi TaxID=300641 RepID=A0AAV2U1B1_CALDB
MSADVVCLDPKFESGHVSGQLLISEVSDETDCEQDDKRLHDELQQLIAEQFEDFDLEDENDNAESDRSVDQRGPSEYEARMQTIEQEDIASILAAGKLSLLEGAIQRFGEDGTEASENLNTDRTNRISPKLGIFVYPANGGGKASRNKEEQFGIFCSEALSMVPSQFDSNYHNINHPVPSSPNSLQKEVTSPGSGAVRKGQSSDAVFSETATRRPLRSTYSVDKSINWDASLPGEGGNELYIALQNNAHTSPSPLQTVEISSHVSESYQPSLPGITRASEVLCSTQSTNSQQPTSSSNYIVQLQDQYAYASDIAIKADTSSAKRSTDVGSASTTAAKLPVDVPGPFFPLESFSCKHFSSVHSDQFVLTPDSGSLPQTGLLSKSISGESREPNPIQETTTTLFQKVTATPPPAQDSNEEDRACLTSRLQNGINSALSGDPEQRRDILYAARGRQLQQMTTEIERLRDEVAKEKRLANHRLTLAESEREVVREKLASSEDNVNRLRQEIKEKQETLEQLQLRLKEYESSNSKLKEEIQTLRLTNESLSNQLVELTTGNAIRRVEEREGKLTEALERRYSVANEELQSELTSTKRRLEDKEQEIADLRRQLENTRADAKKAQDNYNESLSQANSQLNEAQKHYQKLASSGLCTEVNSLRQKVGELETSRKISEDVNKILQEELQDLREQVVVYEGVLKIDGISGGDQAAANADASVAVSEHQSGNGPSVRFGDEAMVTDSQRVSRPSSATERSGTNAGLIRRCSGSQMDANDFERLPSSIRLTHSDSKIKPTSKSNESSVDGILHSLTTGEMLTSTPAPNFVLVRLRRELERCLANYKVKREQVTRLHETVFTTRCQLHQATELAQRMEKNACTLQERVLALERELANVREANDGPGPRENVLSGQLDRLKLDYTKLEEELQATRTRLQSALGAEARALEKEKAATERLAASVAERDAAVDRARVVSEAHYTAMRRRLELDWANEREAITSAKDEQLSRMKQEYSELRGELSRVTKLCEEAQFNTHKAVEEALVEAMQEREAERIRFWREDLPHQLQMARESWERETRFRQKSGKDYQNSNEPSNNQGKDAQSVKINLVKSTRDFGLSTEPSDCLSCETQTDIEIILRLCGLMDSRGDSDDSPSTRFDIQLCDEFHALKKTFPGKQLGCLQLQLISSSIINLPQLNDHLRDLLWHKSHDYSEDAWRNVGVHFDKVVNEYQLESMLKAGDYECPFAPARSVAFAPFETSASLPTSPTQFMKEDESAFVSHVPMIYANTTSTNIPPCFDSSARDRVLLRMYRFARAMVYLRKSLDAALMKLEDARQEAYEATNTNPLASQLYYNTLEKIKREVMVYVHSCQNRAAQTLHAELARVHRRACRQFVAKLRQALCEAGAPFSLPVARLAPADAHVIIPRRSIIGKQPTSAAGFTTSASDQQIDKKTDEPLADGGSLNEYTLKDEEYSPIPQRVPAELESLLHVIDEVCTSTEMKFRADSFTGLPTFYPSSQSPLSTVWGFSSSKTSSNVNGMVSGDLQSDVNINGEKTSSEKSVDSCERKASRVSSNSRHPFNRLVDCESSEQLKQSALHHISNPQNSVTPSNTPIGGPQLTFGLSTCGSEQALTPVNPTFGRYAPAALAGVVEAYRQLETTGPPVLPPRYLKSVSSDEMYSCVCNMPAVCMSDQQESTRTRFRPNISHTQNDPVYSSHSTRPASILRPNSHSKISRVGLPPLHSSSKRVARS